jgi:hypothetical protein
MVYWQWQQQSAYARLCSYEYFIAIDQLTLSILSLLHTLIYTLTHLHRHRIMQINVLMFTNQNSSHIDIDIDIRFSKTS